MGESQSGRRLRSVVVGIAVLWLGVLALAFTYGGASFGPGMMWSGANDGRGLNSACRPTMATGQIVRFFASDGGGMMMGGMMMRLAPASAAAQAGTVTLELANLGSRPHELLVLPLAADGLPGMRPIGAADRVEESAVIGEAKPVCAQPASLDGIAPGNIARVTVDLKPGRYEIVCNLPGHYARGMWALLEVV